MTVTIPQLVAEGLTTAAIEVGAKDDATKLSRAKAAATVAAYFTALGTANIAQANQQINTALASISDPGLEQFLTDLISIGQPFLQAQYMLITNVPILGGSLENALAGIGAGMASVAGGYIAKLTPK